MNGPERLILIADWAHNVSPLQAAAQSLANILRAPFMGIRDSQSNGLQPYPQGAYSIAGET